MAQPRFRTDALAERRWAQPNETSGEATADVLARGWIAAMELAGALPRERADDEAGALDLTDDWTVETVLKLAFAAPDCAYEVGLAIVALNDDPWILKSVVACVFEGIMRQNSGVLPARLAADAERPPKLRRARS